MKRIVQLQLLTVLAALISNSNDGFAQGVGNHITMSMQNAIQISNNIIQFDLMAVSDGDTSSDIRADAFQYGINYDTLILNPGDNIVASYVASTSDFIPPLNGFNFPAAVSKNHIRCVQSVYSGGNTGNRMVVNHQYRVGSFQFQCGTGWVNGSNPNFSLLDSVVVGKTICLAALWLGNSTTTIGFSDKGTGDGQRGLVVNANIILNSVGQLSSESLIGIYPNPSNGKFNVSINEKIGDVELTIYNSMGQIIYSEFIKSEGIKQITLDEVAGIYLVQVKDGTGIFSRKLLVENR